MELKEQIINEVLCEFKDKLEVKTYEHLKNILIIKLNGMKVVKEETSIIPYEFSERENIYKSFLIAKKIEGLTDRSLTYYRGTIEKFMSIVNKNFKDITTEDVRYYIAGCQIQRNWSQTTADNVRRVLNSFFQFLEDDEIIRKNPVKKIKKIKQEKLLKQPFSYEEIERMRVAARDKRDIALIEFLLSTGCRVSEVAALKRNDIDFENHEVIVYGKGRKERRVFLNARAEVRLKEYLKSRTDDDEKLFVTIKRSQKGDRSLRKDGIEFVLREIGKKANIENVHPHRFRRTCATIANKRGMPLAEIQKMLGHESIATTMIYTIVDDKEVKVAHEKYLS